MRRIGRLSVLLLLLGLLSGCASPWPQESASLENQDGAAAVRIKTSIVEALGLAGAAIDVQFEEGRATLRGFVGDEADRERAGTIAREKEYVAEVVNEIQARP